MGPNSQSYPGDPVQSEYERGFGSTVVGGAVGGYMAHEMGAGAMGTAGGAALGAAGMNMVTNMM